MERTCGEVTQLFLEGEWKLFERGHDHIPPAPKQVLPHAQLHCFAKRTVSLFIASSRLPLSLALPSSTSINAKERTTARSFLSEPMFTPQRPFA